MLPTPRLAWRSVLVRERIATRSGLDRDYAHCAELTRRHGRSFAFSSRLLPPPQRRALCGLYAVCRRSDDTVDGHARSGSARLRRWRDELDRAAPDSPDPVVRVWHDLRERYDLDSSLLDDLLLGVESDLRPERRFADLDELLTYCYRVASTVGLLSLPILGTVTPVPPRDEAIALGHAMQLTNILRDVGEDLRAGRLYLPLDHLAAHGVTEADLRAGRPTPGVVAMIEALIEEAERRYQLAWAGVAMLAPGSRFGIAVALTVYREILVEIRRNGHDVFSRRARTSLVRKVRVAAATRLRLNRGQIPALALTPTLSRRVGG